jgi:hypothetical protein
MAGTSQRLSGTLLKQSDILRIWKSRYFVLEDTRLLYYAEPPASTVERPRGIINLAGAIVAQAVRVEDGKHVVDVTLAGGKVHSLASAQAAHAAQWRTALALACVRPHTVVQNMSFVFHISVPRIPPRSCPTICLHVIFLDRRRRKLLKTL